MTFGQFKLLFPFYVKNLLLMKIYGRFYGRWIDRYVDDWARLRDSVKGNDSWLVIGNGPSLKMEDLEALSHLPSIASNKINILFNRTTWRPTFYTIADPLLLHKLPANHYDNLSRVLLPHTHVLMARTKNKLPWRHVLDDDGERKYVTGNETIDPMAGLFVGATITCPNLALAIWGGAKTIYLIGCDHFYTNEDDKHGAGKAVHQGQSNHFDPNYRKPGEVVNPAPIAQMNRGYRMMREIADKRGVRIINITRKTALTAFEYGTVEEAVAATRPWLEGAAELAG